LLYGLTAFYVVFGQTEAIIAKIAKTRLRAKPFQRALICEDRSLKTGVLDGKKITNNNDDSSVQKIRFIHQQTRRQHVLLWKFNISTGAILNFDAFLFIYLKSSSMLQLEL
jgi:hypothetical protein